MNEELAEIEEKIAREMKAWDMLPCGCSVIVGLSGGADSVALTDYLFRSAESNGTSVSAAHVNHGLRGAEAERDEQFVRDFCAARGIPLHVLHADIRSLALEKAQSLEECGREVRYSYFRSLCAPGGRIATAHTLSDSAETVLMNLAKGSGPRGLSGIPPVRGCIVRPLLGITRAEVERYCRLRGLSYVTDSSNLSDDFARNKIRLRVVPVLKEINPEFEAAVARTAEILRSENDVLEKEAERALEEARLPEGGYSLSVLRNLPEPVLLRAAALSAERTAPGRLSFSQLTAVKGIVAAGFGSSTAAGNVCFSISGGRLLVGIQKHPEAPEEWSVPLVPEGTRLPDGRILTLKIVAYDAEKPKIHNLLFNILSGYDTIINNTCFVRNRRAGDAYRPAGRGVTKTMKQLFQEGKVPAAERSRRAILICGGKIVWAEGFGAAEEFRARPDEKSCEIIIKECVKP